MLQLSGNCIPDGPLFTLVDLRRGEVGVVDRLDLPADDARRLMELGFCPERASPRAKALPAAIHGCFRWMARRLPCGARPPGF